MRSAPANILLVVCSLIGTILLFDLALLLVLGPVRAIEDFYRPDPRFGYGMRPNLDFRFASPYNGYDSKVHTNSIGLRDDEVRVPKPPGVFRVLLIGDSMTAGLEVDKNATFEAVSERALSRIRPVEVVNAGVRGYNLDNIVGWLRSEGIGLEPDLVIYFFTDNDVTNLPEWTPAGSDISRGFRIRGVLGRLATYSHLTYRVEVLRQRIQLRRMRDDPHKKAAQSFIPGGILSCFTHSDFDAEPAFWLTAQRMEELHDLCAARGVPFWVATTPQREEIEPEAQKHLASMITAPLDFDGITRFLDWAARQQGSERFDATAVFRAELPRAGTFWFHKDGHLNVRGHRLLGEQLAKAIAASPAFQKRP